MKNASILNRLYNENIELQDKFLKNVSKCGLNHAANLFCCTLKFEEGQGVEGTGEKERIAWCKVAYPEVRDDEGEVLAPRLFRCFSKKGISIFGNKEDGTLHTLDEIRELVYSNSPVLRVQN